MMLHKVWAESIMKYNRSACHTVNYGMLRFTYSSDNAKPLKHFSNTTFKNRLIGQLPWWTDTLFLGGTDASGNNGGCSE